MMCKSQDEQCEVNLFVYANMILVYGTWYQHRYKFSCSHIRNHSRVVSSLFRIFDLYVTAEEDDEEAEAYRICRDMSDLSKQIFDYFSL